MLLVSGWSRIEPQCGQKAGPVVVDVAAKKLMAMATVATDGLQNVTLRGHHWFK